MSIPSISAGAVEISDSKLFEKECWEALNRMGGVELFKQGRCIEYRHEGHLRACPDIVGSYQEAPERWRRGFVVDCKLYHDIEIHNEDVGKLRRDVRAAGNELVRQKFIGNNQNQNVKGIFVSTTDRIVPHHDLQLITIDYDGGLGQGWERALQTEFRAAMRQ